MTFPEMWDYANTPLNTIERTKKFLTHCPFKNFLHVTVDLNRTNLLDASNQATFEALKAAMAENEKQFTLKLQDPSAETLRTLSELPCALSVAYHSQDLPLGPWRNLQTLEIRRHYLQTLPLEPLTSLTHLTVARCYHLQNLSLDQCTNLTHLNVNDSANLQSLPLEPLTSLTHLTVRYCKNLQNLALAQLTNLTQLTVGNCRNLHNITSGHLPHLYTLDIQGCPVLPQEQRDALKVQVHANGGQVEPYAR